MGKRMLSLLGVAASLTLASGVHAADSRQGADLWRASKLIGVPIYGAASTSVGKISDVLLRKDGRIDMVVIGVGGFLGLGEKDVAVPYDQVKFSEQPIALVDPQPATAKTTEAAAGGVATAPPLGTTKPAGGITATMPDETSQHAAPAPAASGKAYPDHGMIDMTTEQLKNAPSFHFAS